MYIYIDVYIFTYTYTVTCGEGGAAAKQAAETAYLEEDTKMESLELDKAQGSRETAA